MLIRHPESVAIVAVDGDEVVLVRQRRPGAKGRTLELPAGTLEPGETPEAAARRELAEECGLTAQSWLTLGAFWVAPAYSTELAHIVEARGLEPTDRKLDADEDIVVERRPLRNLDRLLSDATSIAALALWAGRGTAPDRR